MAGPNDDGVWRDSGDATTAPEDFPTLPVVVSLLAALEPDTPDSFDQVLALARCEPCLAIDLLQHAGRHAPPESGYLDSLETALSRIGVAGIRALIDRPTNVVFSPATDAQKLLWLHSLQVASASELLAQRTPGGGVSPQTARLAGLVHDLGRFVSYRDDPLAPDRVDAFGYQTPDALQAAERYSSAPDHAALGEQVAAQLGLPPLLVQVIGGHHGASPPAPGTRAARLIELVRIADTISLHCMQGDRSQLNQVAAIVERVTAVPMLEHYPALLQELQSIAERSVQLAFADFERLRIGRTHYHALYDA